MKKRYIIFTILFIIFGLSIFTTTCHATDLDEILDYTITVDPNMNDGSLDITYEIKWKVLNSTIEGPLSWVKIGTANPYFDSVKPLSTNIKNINASDDYVNVYFKQNYKAGETITFKYSLHQKYVYKVSFGTCTYNFTPAWFTDINVDNITVKWNKDEVKSNNSNTSEDNYLVWNKKNLAKGDKLKVQVKYNKKAFSSLDTAQKETNSTFSILQGIMFMIVLVIVVIAICSIGGGRRILRT